VSIRYLIGDVRERLADIADGSVSFIGSSPPFMALRSYLPDGHPNKDREIGSERDPATFVQTLLDITADCGRKLAPWGSLAFELGDTYAGSGGAGGDYADGGAREGQNAFDGSAARGRRRDHDESGRLPRKRTKPISWGSPEPAVDAAPPDRLRTRRQLPGWPQAKSLALIPQAYALSLAYGRNVLTGEPSPAGQWLVRNEIVWHRPNPAVGSLGDKVRPSTSYITVATRSPERWFDLTAVRGEPSSNTHARTAKGVPARPTGRRSSPSGSSS